MSDVAKAIVIDIVVLAAILSFYTAFTEQATEFIYLADNATCTIDCKTKQDAIFLVYQFIPYLVFIAIIAHMFFVIKRRASDRAQRVRGGII